MFTKRNILVLFILSSFLVTATGLYLFHAPKGVFFNPKPLLIFPKGSTYEKEWKKVDSLTQKGLTQSALSVVEGIYTRAKSDSNAPQIVKAVIHRIKLESHMEEYSLQKSIEKMNAEIKDAKYPLKPILHSMLAELYWSYYENNRWKFQNRTQAVGPDSYRDKMEDINTWDLKTIVDQTVKQYQFSLRSVDSLKLTPLNIYDEVLTHDEHTLKGKPASARKLRPSLYDFLAHRAVDFYINEEPDVIKPAYKFELSSESYFWDHNDFVKLNLTPDPSPSGVGKFQDSLNLKFYAIKLLQDIIAFHNNSSDTEALVDADLKRLKFVKNKSVVDFKDSLYMQALRQLEKKFIQSPASSEAGYEIALAYNERGSKYQPLVSDENKWEKKTALSVCEEAIKRFPDSYGAHNCRHLKAQILAKSLSFNVEQANLPDKPFRALVKYGNVNKVFVRVAKHDADRSNSEMGNYDYYGEKLIEKFLKAEIVKEWEVNLPDDGDFQSHSVEIKMPELPFGHYVILAGTDKKFSYNKEAVAYGSCFSTELSNVQRRTSDGGYDFTVMHRATGHPLKGVSAQLWYQKYNYISREYEYKKGDFFETGDDGAFHIPPSGEGYNNYYVEMKKGSDRYYSDNGMYMYKNQKQEKHFYPHTHMFTDRAIYRPGQTIYFKGIMLESDGETQRILSKRTETVTLYDVNYQEVSKISLTTNEYGSFNGTFTLPQNLMNGQMQLGTAYGYVYVSVEDYKRPKFEVTAPPVKGVYRLNENVTVTGKAKSYAGANIDGAEVKYRVVRNASFPYYWGWWRGYSPASPEMEITNGITTTNDTGGFSITFKAIPDMSLSKKYSPLYTYSIYSDVTDIAGETHSCRSSVSVGYKAMKMSIDIPGQVNKNETSKIPIRTTNLNGEFEPAKGRIEIWKLEEPARLFRGRLWEQADKHLMTREEYYAAFPNDLYSDEDNSFKWKKQTLAFVKDFSNEHFPADPDRKSTKTEFNTTDTLHLALQAQPPGMYVMEAITKDKFGEEVKEAKYFTLYSAAGSIVPVNGMDWFTAIKYSGEPGEKASLLVGSKATDVKILFETEHKNEIVKKEWITLNSGQKMIEIPIEEKHRGNFAYHLVFIKNGRAYAHDGTITVPYTNKELDIEFETFRNKLLPGQKEEWKVKIRDKKGDKMAAEMLATMYDASLDAFRPNNWYFNIYNSYYAQRSWEIHSVARNNGSQIFSEYWNEYSVFKYKYYDKLNWFGHYMGYDRHGYEEDGNRDIGGSSRNFATGMAVPEESERKKYKGGGGSKDKETVRQGAALAPNTAETAGADLPPVDKAPEGTGEGQEDGKSPGQIQARANLAETAFFFPQLETDANGSVIIKFTIPEALTKWKMMGLAHTKDLKYGQIQKELVTQKELMVTPHAPRFFRENDKITFTAKVDNLSAADMNGTAQLFLYDAVTMKEVAGCLSPSGGGVHASRVAGEVSFTARKNQSAPLSWDLTIPEGIGAITYKVVAKAGNFTDGEEAAIPILTNRTLVTESMPLPVRSKQTKNFKFEKFISQNNGSTTLRNHKLTLEFSANPAWYAVQALPYIMEYPYECAEQTFSRFYANSIASHIANSSPKIKAVFDSWKSSSPPLRGGAGGEAEAFLSNLQKNQELKSLMLEETPWVLDAKDESERKKRVALLFDLNKMSNELESALKKLQKMQVSNGGWPWFDGMPDDRYITQHIVTGLGHLDHLGVKNIRQDSRTWDMTRSAVRYLDDRIREDYEWILKHDKANIEKDHIWHSQIQYLYARSYFSAKSGSASGGKDIPIEARNQKAFDYYKGQAQKYWLGKGRYMNGMIALGLHRYGDKKIPMDIMKSLKENALVSEEMGMYWKENYEGFYWYEAPIECQSLLIEAFDEVSNDKKAVDDLKVWLLKSKQTQNWESTKATTEAVYALLLRGTDWLATESNVEISLGGLKIDPKNMPDVKVEAGTGYFKTSWSGSDIKPQMGNVTVNKKDEGVSWGAVYWQYFEQLDKITPHKTPLQLVKKLFIQKNTASGPVIEPITENTKLKPGDKLKVRIELRVDRDMQYVHMKDMRASGFEPVNVFSQYKYQDGLGYYESTRDAATNFFFSNLNKGTYVFEYPLMVSHSGDFSNGITSIQCMYAPEFTSHSEGIRVKVGK